MGRGYAAATALFLLAVALVVGQNQPSPNRGTNQIDAETVSRWGQKFGTDLWHSLSQATRREEIQKQYESHPNLKVDEVDGFLMVREMAAEVQIMMQHKIDAIKRIMELAENIALDHKYDKERGSRLAEGRYHYVNAKKLNVLSEEDDHGEGSEYERYLSQYRDPNDELYAPGYSRLMLEANSHFSGIPVNTSSSSVHVPTNVFDGEPKVINAIDWSKKLDVTFEDNYRRDPSLSWQYFGSSTGFLRQYPAIKWLTYEDDPDMYDARMRDWYIKSAASSKDVVILLDTSGSMTGLRKEIAKHVVLNIMETLGEDDFLTVLTFSDETRSLVDCFTDEDGDPQLVQATTENIAEFTEAVNNIETEEIANFTAALSSAFSLLEKYRTGKIKGGTGCNQAIMLVTDGVPYKFETIFQEYNEPVHPVRMFTYLIGREISDIEAARWMACNNKGYFTHVTTLAEVKEQVLKYIPVMARPLVLLREHHPVRWTGVYADIEVPNDRSLWVIGLKKPMSRRAIHEARGQEGTFKGYKLMTSVSIPVYNKKNSTTYDELGLKRNEISDPFNLVRIAELLGVAGTDVPIAQIEKLIPPYKLGVNGYSFAVNNNGYILYHPDLRPMFQEILKPNYNSVDLAEVELIHKEVDEKKCKKNKEVLCADEPRLNDRNLFEMRRDMVDQKEGQSRLTVRLHMDDMKRVTIREQDYFYHNISNTPFTLGIVFPDKYGRYRVTGGLEVNDPSNRQRNGDLSGYLEEGGNWKLHPDWVYCEYNYGGRNGKVFDTPEQNMRHFIDRLDKEKGSFDWGQSRVRPLPKCSDGPYQAGCVTCDKELVQAMILDAQITNIFTEKNSRKTPDALFKLFGINLSFVATRSGLTRWEEHKPPPAPNDPGYMEDDDTYDPNNPKEPHFSEVNNEATDEVWYKRAVDYHYNNPQSFVFSVPFDIGDKRPTQVMATHAIFKGKGNRKAPAGVVGVEINYDHFRDTFMNTTNKDGGPLSCASDSVECYVVDNNGFVVISEDKLNTGKFFGEIDGTILKSLVNHKVFKQIKVYDYQAICLESADDGSPASSLLNPFKAIAWAFNWVIGQIAFTIIRMELHHLWNPDWTYAMPQQQQLPPPIYDYDSYANYDTYPNQQGSMEQQVPDMDEGMVEEEYEEGYDEHNDELVKEYMLKNGGPIPILEMTYINKTQPKPCDKEVDLYELQAHVLADMGRPLQGILRNCHESNCERPFTVALIPNTNLILVVADTTCPCYSARETVAPTKVDYGPANETTYCEKLKTNLYRKKPHQCINYHLGEEEINLCGSAVSVYCSALLLPALILINSLFH